MNKKKIILSVIGVLVIFVIIFAIKSSGNDEMGVKVKTSVVKEQKIVETVTATGRIQPKTQVKISADVAAKIIKLDLKEGAWVEKGQFLVQLDKERYSASVESAEANLRSAEANSKLVKENMLKAEKDFARIKELFDKKLESQAALDQYYAAKEVEKARFQSSLEQVDQVKAALKQAKDDLSKTTIYSPMDGTVSKLNKEVGEIALGSQFQEDVIMIISNLSGMEALVNVDENDIVSVSIGDSAEIEVDALPNSKFKGVVSEIANSANIAGQGSIDQKTEFEVKIAIDSPGKKLRPGMTSSADIITEIKENVVGVPIQSVAVRSLEQLTAGENKEFKKEYNADKDGFVQVLFVVNDDKCEAKQIETGIQSETQIEIKSGIKTGDEIVTGSYRAISQTLKNGSKIIKDKKKELQEDTVATR